MSLSSSSPTPPDLVDLFSPETVRYISNSVSKRVYDQIQKVVIVPDDKIVLVLQQMYAKCKGFNIGCIYSMVLSRQYETLNDVIEETITYITTDVSNNVALEDYYHNLSKWDSILSIDNTGKQAHMPIKINNIRTHRRDMGFMRY